MYRLKTSLAVLLVIVLAFSFSASVMAHGGVDDGDSETSQSSSEDKMASAQAKKQELVEKFKAEAREKNEAAKTKVEEKTTEARQKACEARKTAVENRLAKRSSQATKHKEVFDKIFLRVKNFHDSKNLSTENYDALVEAVETAQANVTTQITALDSLDTSIDCSDSNVANNISTFKVALQSTKSAMKEYKTTLVNLIKAVKQSAVSTSEDN